MRVLMSPMPEQMVSGESGIHTVIRNYARICGDYGIEITRDGFELAAIHAGTFRIRDVGVPIVSHLHGMYWTGDFLQVPKWQHFSNHSIVESIRHSEIVTVPSEWVAETIRRDLRLEPEILPHGVEWESWQHDKPNRGYIMGFTKNRAADVCDPTMSNRLATERRDLHFVQTFGEKQPNVHITGVVKHDKMKELVQGAAVFIAPVKETFCIAALEAMAAGIPVLTVNRGHAPELVQHGVAGYCYRDNDIEDMMRGLEYCLEHRDVLSKNARELARQYTWEAAVAKLREIYDRALSSARRKPNVGVVIPVYNKRPDQIERAIESVHSQFIKSGVKIVVVDDGSTNKDTIEYLDGIKERVIRQENKGVAHARNAGIAALDTKYVCPLDADDAIEPDFLKDCVEYLEGHRDVGVAYTRLGWVTPDGKTGVSSWPDTWDFDQFLKRKNQVPTCSVFRREIWERLGGYKQRYAPTGAGSEDAEFYLRAGAYGFKGALVTERPLFTYSWKSGHTSSNYQEEDWLAWHVPWTTGKFHPLASYAKPKNEISHPIYTYDEPEISVVIPVGPNHAALLVDALDSLENQTVIKWEAIVVFDNHSVPDWMKKAYPYVKWLEIAAGSAGVARNRGAEIARGDMLVFLDADDYLYPTYLEEVIDRWNMSKSIVYTDYAGIATIDDPDKLAPDLKDRILETKHGLTTIGYRTQEFDCARAIEQPRRGKLYHWCNVTVLVPKAWHDAIGGFDEAMESWEDVDYFWRLAKNGYCFSRLAKRLMVYRFGTGGRRQDGLQNWDDLLSYLEYKHNAVEVKDTMCGCNNKNAPKPYTPSGARAVSGGIEMQAQNPLGQDSEMLLVWYNSGQRGQVGVRGTQTRRFYGARAHGDKFLIHRDDQRAQPHLFPLVAPEIRKVEEPPVQKKVVGPPVAIVDEDPIPTLDLDDEPEKPTPEPVVFLFFDPEDIKGVGPTLSKTMRSRNLNHKAAVLAAGVDGLMKIDRVSQTLAEKIIEYVNSLE